MFLLHLRARPNAKANALLRAADGRLTVRLQAPAQDGRANACLLAYLAGVFGVAKSQVLLLSGHTSLFKKVGFPDLSEEEGQEMLRRLL